MSFEGATNSSQVSIADGLIALCDGACFTSLHVPV